MENGKYKPVGKKQLSPFNLALFTQRAEKLPKDDRQQKRDKFRLKIKNKIKNV
tara:strand:- start:287 stop:445 length:159 start_codon:yes stop_codon:yes gene_type:complete